MATYNFTIRAFDNVGAFADRSFSINVLKTRVHRFVVQTPEGFLLSTNGDDWKFEQDKSTSIQTYGNGMWVGSVTPSSVRYSQDGRNWKSKTYTLTPVATFGFALASYIKYSDGKWMIVGSSYQSGSNATPAMWVSDDNMATWALQSRITTAVMSIGANPVLTDCDYDPATQTTVVYQSGSGLTTAPTASLYRGIYTKVGDGSWVFNPIGNMDPRGSGTVTFTNGLWIVTNGSRFIWLSRDGLTWMSRCPGGVAGHAIGHVVSCNGALVALQNPTVNVNHGLLVSTDGGYTWTQTAPFALPYAYTSSGRNIAEYNGTIVVTAAGGANIGTRGGAVYTTKNMGETWSTYSVQTLTGTNSASAQIISRND